MPVRRRTAIRSLQNMHIRRIPTPSWAVGGVGGAGGLGANRTAANGGQSLYFDTASAEGRSAENAFAGLP